MLLSRKVSRTMDAPSWMGGWQETWLLSRPSALSQGGKAGRCPQTPLCPWGGRSRAGRVTQLLACPGGDAGLGHLWLGCAQWATWAPSRPGVPGWLAGWSCPGRVEAGGPPSRSLASVRSSGSPAYKPLNRPVSSPDLLWGHFTRVPFHQWLRTDDRPGAGAPGALSSPAIHPASPARAHEAALAVTVPGTLCWAQPHNQAPQLCGCGHPWPLCPPAHRSPQQPVSLPSAFSPGAIVGPWTSLSSCAPSPPGRTARSHPKNHSFSPTAWQFPQAWVPDQPSSPASSALLTPSPTGRLPSAAPGGSQTPWPRPSVLGQPSPSRPTGQPLAGCPLTSCGHRSSVTSGSTAQSQGGEGVPEGVRPVAGGFPEVWPETRGGILTTRFARHVLGSVPGLGLQGAAWECSAREQRGQWRVETVAMVREPGIQVGRGRPSHGAGGGQRRSQACAESTRHPQPASSLGGGGCP